MLVREVVDYPLFDGESEERSVFIYLPVGYDEEENKDKHFDLTIEDKGSKYFKPTQIKIGDGFHAFKELNWLQTFDPSRMESAVSNGITAAANTIMGKFTDLDNKVTNFIEVDAGKILQELVKGRYFTLSDDVVLSCFNTEGVSDDELKSFSIGYNNNFNYNGIKGKRSIIFGEKNSLSGFYDYINGSSNKIEKGNGDFIHGAGNTIRTDSNNNKVYNICFGLWNTISDGDHNFTCGISNEIYQTKGYSNIFNTSFGKNNKISGNYNFIYGYGNNAIASDYSCCLGETNKVIGQHGFAGGRNSYASDYSIAYGDDINAKLKSQSIVPGKYSVSFGRSNNTKGESSFSCGYGNKSEGDYSFSCGSDNIVSGTFSFSSGISNNNYGHFSASFGAQHTINFEAPNSFVCGFENTIYKGGSFACGLYNITYEEGAFACGHYNDGKGKLFSVGNGYYELPGADHRQNAFDIDINGKATFYGGCDIKLGFDDDQNELNKDNAKNFSIGNNKFNYINKNGAEVFGYNSFAFGNNNVITGNSAFACGIDNISSRTCSFACGTGNIASVNNSFACGQYNLRNINKLFSVGNGADENNRSNIFDIDTSGKATFYGDLEVKGSVVYGNDIHIGERPKQYNITDTNGMLLSNNSIMLIPMYDNIENEYQSLAYEFHYELTPGSKYIIGLFDPLSSLSIYPDYSNLTDINKFVIYNVPSNSGDYCISFTCNFEDKSPKFCKIYVIQLQE